MGYPDGLFGERAGDHNLRNIKLERVSKNIPKSCKVREEVDGRDYGKKHKCYKRCEWK